jgi:putative membrane protein
MAVILNIYDKILLALSRENLKQNITFLGFIATGTAIGIFSFSKAITYLFENYYTATNFCFIGLVIGSIPMLYKRAKCEGFQKRNWIPFAFALLFMSLLAIIKLMPGSSDGVFSVDQLAMLPMIGWLFISAFISTIGMILPGISGSFLMLLFGVYNMTLRAISEFDFQIILPVSLGILFGGVVGVKFIKILLRNHPQALYAGIIGLMIGSIFLIFPGFRLDFEGGVSVIGLSICSAASYLFSRKN